jgi:two-component system response regulator NreC
MLIDDHQVLRTGLKTLLDGYPDFEVVAEASNGEEALECVVEANPEVIVMDISMPGMDGMDLSRRIRDLLPDSQILTLTIHEDKQYFFKMLEAGASGYVTKRAAADELVSAIRTVAEGNIYLQPALAQWLLDDYRRLAERDTQMTQDDSEAEIEMLKLESLSKRELEVLELVSEGYTSSKIGERLGISPNTVSRHRERIMKKLNIHSSPELVKFAIRTGLIDL